jgi:hypothetical protein
VGESEDQIAHVGVGIEVRGSPTLQLGLRLPSRTAIFPNQTRCGLRKKRSETLPCHNVTLARSERDPVCVP